MTWTVVVVISAFPDAVNNVCYIPPSNHLKNLNFNVSKEYQIILEAYNAIFELFSRGVIVAPHIPGDIFGLEQLIHKGKSIIDVEI